MARLKEVRVTNPGVADIPQMMLKPAKIVAGFGVGVAVGNVALSPVTDKIDDSLDSGLKRGSAKLLAATGILTAIAVITEKQKSKVKGDSGAIIAAASIGSVSRLITTGIDDLMGRGAEPSSIVIDADLVADNDEVALENKNMGVVLDAKFFDKPAEMSGATSLYAERSFGAYME